MKWNDEALNRLKELRASRQHPWADAAEEFGTTAEAARKAWNRAVKAGRVEEPKSTVSGGPKTRKRCDKRVDPDGSVTVAAPRGRVTNISELLALAEIPHEVGEDGDVRPRAYRLGTVEIGTYETAMKVADPGEIETALRKVKRGDWALRDAASMLNAMVQERVVPMATVRAKLLPLRGERILRDLRARLFEDLRQAGEAIDWPAPERPVHGDPELLFEPGGYDVHLGKLAWGEETGGPSQDLRLASRDYLAAMDDLATKCELRYGAVGEVCYVIGQDFFHFDTQGGQTTRGTQVDHDGRYIKVFREGRRVAVRSIERFLKLGPVKVVVVPGNHAELTEFLLGEVLDAWFRGHPDVSVDTDYHAGDGVSPRLRKYVRWGTVGLGFTHAAYEKPKNIPHLMSIEAPWWSDVRWREMHQGHLHHRRGNRPKKGRRDDEGLAYREHGGCIIRTLPSLSAADDYHYRGGWVGSLRGSEGYLWHRRRGLEGMVNHWPDAIPEDEQAA